MLKQNIKPDWEHLYYGDMDRLGEIFEYALHQGYNMKIFVEQFMNSWIRESMDNWHPQFSNGPVQWTVYTFINDYPNIPLTYEENNYPYLSMRWIGMTYSFLSYYLNMPSKELYSILPFEQMVVNYSTGHERSFESFANVFIEDYNRDVG